MCNDAACIAPFHSERGLTLVELMVSITIGLFVVGVAVVLLLTAKSGYIAQSDSAQILDSGRYALDVVSRTVRQASYMDWNIADAVPGLKDDQGPAVFGMDAQSLKSRTEGVSSPVGRSINGSDVLAIRFAGSGEGSDGDGSVLNCGGFGVGVGNAKDGDNRGWSIFYVAEDASGEPELYCKYPGDDGWTAQAVARGVESFQVLYALDTDGDGYPNTLANATTINAMTKTEEKSTSRHGPWKSVVAIKVAVLVRGANPVQTEKENRQYDLFGKRYADAFSGRDKGVRIQSLELPIAVRSRARKVFGATVWLRNRPVGE